MDQLRFLIADGLAAAVYTQTTDVESEVNGMLTYDREVTKLPPGAIASARRLYQPAPRIREIVPSSWREPQTWRYTTAIPPGDWFQPGFDDSKWMEGPGGFGREETPGGVVRTRWETGDIWIRRSFDLPDRVLVNPTWRIHHDEDVEVYLNGVPAAAFPGYTTGYVRLPLTDFARRVLHPGRNTIAVHVHQTEGGQYIDVGIDEILEP